MSGEIIFVFGLLAVTIALFIWDKFRMDIVALLVAITLAVSGIISPKEAVSGFGASVVVMIAALFIVGEGLFRTGIADMAGQWLFRVGGTNEARLLLFMMPLIAFLSAFMSSTGAVALLIPVVLSMCRKSGISPSKLLMPLAFASLVGGMLTLIGTPPNIIVSGQLEKAGFDGFSFFDFTPIGMVILMVTLAYIVFIGRKLLPNNKIQRDQHGNPSVNELADRYGAQGLFNCISVPEESPLMGETASTAGLRVKYEATLFGVKRPGRLASTLLPVMTETQIQAGDLLCIHSNEENINRLEQDFSVKAVDISNREREQLLNEFGLAEVMLRRESNLLGKTIQQGEFRKKFGLNVIGLRRDNQAIETQFSETPLKFADSMLVVGAWRYIAS